MSEKILFAQLVGTRAAFLFIIFITLFIILGLIINLIVFYFRRKNKKLKNEILQNRYEYNEKISVKYNDIMNNNAKTDIKILEEIANLRNELNIKQEENYNKIIKNEKKISVVASFYPVLIPIIIFAIMTGLYMCRAFAETGCNTSMLHEAEYKNQGVEVLAYYVVEYQNVEQVTLTVFVKNESEKGIKCLIVKEKGTNNSSILYNLESGEEKIVTIDSYEKDNYEFEIVDIQFVE